MGKSSNKLKLGKGAAFVKRQLQRLPQTDAVWETNFSRLDDHGCWLGLVVCPPSEAVLANHAYEHEPTVNDLATLLARAMRRPELGDPSRPGCVRLVANPAWEELLPHLNDLGIRTETVKRLKAYQTVIRDVRQELKGNNVREPDWTNNKEELLQQDFEGLCYTAVLRWISANKVRDWSVVHGTVLSLAARKRRIEHAWCEKGDIVVDLAMPVGSRIIERERYYRVLQPEVAKVYSGADALLLSLKNNHDGPWDESEQLDE